MAERENSIKNEPAIKTELLNQIKVTYFDQIC
jgi:hypothetical protein